MTTAVDVAGAALPSRRWAWTVVVAAGAVVTAMAVALTNQPYFELVNRWVGANEPLTRGAVYSSYLLLIGVAVVARSPAAYGIGLGETLRHWRTVVVAVGGMAALTTSVLLLVPPTPYADAHWVNEVVIVPLTEELVFRGMLVTILLGLLSHLHPPSTAAVLAVCISAIAFSLGHAANALSLPASFVIAQVTYAAIIGVVAGATMMRTRSIIAPILVHAAVNAVVVAF